MPRITKLHRLPAKPPEHPEAKILVYIDHTRCIPVRERIWPALSLGIGSEISCDELRQREKFHWKLEYQKRDAWAKERTRLGRVRELVGRLDHRLKPEVTGFGAGSTEVIWEHPPEAGRPDIEVFSERIPEPVLLIEVTGTERMRGSTYWVRPDKLRYAERHPHLDVWVVLHYAEPAERFVFIKPRPGAAYAPVEKVIHDSRERYVEFADGDAEVRSRDYFEGYIHGKLGGVYGPRYHEQPISSPTPQ